MHHVHSFLELSTGGSMELEAAEVENCKAFREVSIAVAELHLRIAGITLILRLILNGAMLTCREALTSNQERG